MSHTSGLGRFPPVGFMCQPHLFWMDVLAVLSQSLSAAGVSRQAVEQVAGLSSNRQNRRRQVQHLGKAYGGVRVRGSEAQAGLVDLQGGAEFDTVYLY